MNNQNSWNYRTFSKGLKLFSDHGTLSFVVPNEYKIAKRYDLHSISNVCYDVNSTVRRQKMPRKKVLAIDVETVVHCNSGRESGRDE